jgi:hypothetical protein
MLSLRSDGYSLEAITHHVYKWRRPNGYRWNINSITRALRAAKARFAKEFAEAPRRRRAAASLS